MKKPALTDRLSLPHFADSSLGLTQRTSALGRYGDKGKA